uniref:Putative structural protein n=1 Tax=viral metagenome TaxID=1070528 RepID=A0A6M3L2F0_9ZZZZ
MENEELEIPKKKLDETTKLRLIDGWYDVADRAQNGWEVAGRESLDFVCNKQWSAEDVRILKEQNRPALTFNELLPLINLISGYERQNKQDIKPFARRNGSQEVANILFSIIKDIFYSCDGSYELSASYVMGLITGKGYIGLDVNTNDDFINGQINIENISPWDIKVDPFGVRYDLDDRDYLFHSAWMSKEKIAQTFPEIKDALGDLRVGEKEMQTVLGHETHSYKENAADSQFEIDIHRYLIKRCYWREYKKLNILVNQDDGRVHNLDIGIGQARKIVKNNPRLKMINPVIPQLNLTTKVGNLLLEEIEDPYNGMWRFPVIPFYAYFLDNNIFGMIESLKDPQRETNKRYSQTLHHLNMTANSGLMFEEGSIANEDEINDLGMKPGIQIKTRKGIGYKPEVINPAQLSNGHITLMELSKNFIKSLSGVNTDLLGASQDQGESSGIAREASRKQGLIILEPLYDNFRRTKRLLGKRLIDFIQKSGAYSKEEVLNLMVNGKQVQAEINQKQGGGFGPAEQVLNDVTVGKYDVVIDETPSSPTAKMANFASMLEALKLGMPIPPEQIVEASDWPNKEEIKQGVSIMKQFEQMKIENEQLKQNNGQMSQALGKLQEGIQQKVRENDQKLKDDLEKMSIQ